MPHGGARTPSQPATSSGPGRFSKRTDGGPADKTANLVAPGGTYGSRQALEGQQAAAPVPVTPPAEIAATQGPQGRPEEVFGPPGGVPPQPSQPVSGGPVTDPDVDMTLRALYRQFPSPYIGRLLSDR